MPRNGFVGTPEGRGPRCVELRFSLPEYSTVEPWRDAFATQRTVTFKWRGDEIVEVDPVGEYLAPYPAANGVPTDS